MKSPTAPLQLEKEGPTPLRRKGFSKALRTSGLRNQVGLEVLGPFSLTSKILFRQTASGHSSKGRPFVLTFVGHLQAPIATSRNLGRLLGARTHSGQTRRSKFGVRQTKISVHAEMKSLGVPRDLQIRCQG